MISALRQRPAFRQARLAGERLNSPDGTVRADSVQMIHIGAYSMRYGTRSGVGGRQRETVM
ncbi:hypothetical protein DOE73_21500 [Paenibacillus dendritiformis]|nr:hypothetical protein DOE73_21500 [Paenibacillus dendritiformis]